MRWYGKPEKERTSKMNKITLEYIPHQTCRDKAKELLAKMDDDGTNLYAIEITTDSGYIYYKITLQNRHTVTVYVK